MATSAPFADRHGRACLTSVASDHRSQVQRRGSVNASSRDCSVHVWPDLVAATANGGTKVDQHVASAETSAREFIEATGDNSGRGSLPTAVKDRAESRWVAEKYRDAVGKGHGHRRPVCVAQVAVGARRVTQPSGPCWLVVVENAVAVHLERRRQSLRRNERLNKSHPPAKDARRRFLRRQIEAPRLTSGRERGEAKLREALKAGVPKPLTTSDLAAAAATLKPTTKEWFATARNHALYSNQGGTYDEILKYLKMT